jgi:hypothetical protein
MDKHSSNGNISFFPRFFHPLIEPSSMIMDLAQRRRATLLSTFLLSMFVVFVCINTGYAIFIPGYSLPLADIMSYAILISVYLLSRTKHTRLASVIILLMFPFNVFTNVLSGTTSNMTATLSFLIPSYILAGVFLSVAGAAVYGLICCFLIALLPFLNPLTIPEFSHIVGPLAVNFLSVILVLIFLVHRNRIERDRRNELLETYNHTLEGLSRILEVRDKETEGHCRRVTEMTMQMALAFGINGDKLDHIYRGALLHDVGKMAIPDSVLMKTDALTQEELALMHTHPTIASQMLSSIPFLKPALEIPECHHEWWNGEGYPKGLKGENIPLSARIFAVVDVWDALLSDRPYRKALTKEQAMEYLRTQRGKQFDPDITDKFLALQINPK